MADFLMADLFQIVSLVGLFVNLFQIFFESVFGLKEIGYLTT